MNDKMYAIRAVEEKYGNVTFRMGVSHLFDVGSGNLISENVEEGFKQIHCEYEANKANGRTTFMTPEFQCGILRCAAELSIHSVWDLIRYVKSYMDI